MSKKLKMTKKKTIILLKQLKEEFEKGTKTIVGIEANGEVCQDYVRNLGEGIKFLEKRKSRRTKEKERIIWQRDKTYKDTEVYISKCGRFRIYQSSNNCFVLQDYNVSYLGVDGVFSFNNIEVFKCLHCLQCKKYAERLKSNKRRNKCLLDTQVQ